jgi:hypothetical protein
VTTHVRFNHGHVAISYNFPFARVCHVSEQAGPCCICGMAIICTVQDEAQKYSQTRKVIKKVISRAQQLTKTDFLSHVLFLGERRGVMRLVH